MNTVIFRKKNTNKTNNTSNKSIVDELDLTTQNIKSILGKSKDVKFKQLHINGDDKFPVYLVYIEGLVDNSLINEFIIKPLTHDETLKSIRTFKDCIDKIQKGALPALGQQTHNELYTTLKNIIDGEAALVFDELKQALTFNTIKFEKRAISEPTGENIIKGSKDSFVETLRVNTATIRRKIKTPNLIIEEITIGKQTITSVAIVYIEGLTNSNIIEEVKKRLNTIDVDSVLSVNMIEENIIDNPYYIFPQTFTTERPIGFCNNITDGRLGIIIDGIPLGIIVPATITMFLQAPEDYSQSPIISSLIRSLRYCVMFITLLLPAFYISVTTFHPEMIPSELVTSISSSKEGVPFPMFIEVIIMLIAFEILLEAGLRLPKSIGQAVSVVGALVVGEAAVSAKFISPGVVMIIATTAISSFTMPNQDFSNALRFWRFTLAILASIAGLFGLTIGCILILFSLSKLSLYGIAYLSPFASQDSKQLGDSFVRLPMKFYKSRPLFLKTTNTRKQK
jgi:spore germination protein KA